MQKIVLGIALIIAIQINAHTAGRKNTNDGVGLLTSMPVDSIIPFNKEFVVQGENNNYDSEQLVFNLEQDNAAAFLVQFENPKRLLNTTRPIPEQYRFYAAELFYDTAFDYLGKPLESVAKSNLKEYSKDLLALLPNVAIDQDDTYDGTAYSSKTLQLFAKDNHLKELVNSKIKLADHLIMNRKYRQGIALYKKILNAGEKWAVDKNVLFEATRSLGNVFAVRKQFDSAMIYQRSAFVLADRLGLGVDKKIDAYRDIGITFAEMGRDEASLETYKKTIEIALTEGGGKRSIGVLYLLISGCYERLQYYDTMGYYLDKYKALEINSFIDADLEFYRLLSVGHKAKGEYELALEDLEKMNAINDSVYTLNLSDKVLTLNKQDKMETNEKESVLLQRKNESKILTRVESKDKRIYYLKGLMIGLSIIALFIFIALYKNRKLTRELAQMNDTVHLQRNEIASSLDNEKNLNKKLHQANSTLEHFFSIIAHDLRSPYNVMLGYADMLVNNFDLLKPEDVKDCLATLRKKAYKNYQLTQNLLSWAMMQKGGMIVNKKESYVRKIVYSSISLHKELADKKGITLINKCPTTLTGSLDKDIVASVLSNLINNALKFTNKYGSVTISAKKMGENILFKVDDTGLGMSKKTRKNLFNLDKVSSKPGTADEPGAGLGLILCKELVTSHQGTIRVKSKIGKGTTVLALL